jgi:hypothetical protein
MSRLAQEGQTSIHGGKPCAALAFKIPDAEHLGVKRYTAVCHLCFLGLDSYQICWWCEPWKQVVMEAFLIYCLSRRNLMMDTASRARKLGPGYIPLSRSWWLRYERRGRGFETRHAVGFAYSFRHVRYIPTPHSIFDRLLGNIERSTFWLRRRQVAAGFIEFMRENFLEWYRRHSSPYIFCIVDHVPLIVLFHSHYQSPAGSESTMKIFL